MRNTCSSSVAGVAHARGTRGRDDRSSQTGLPLLPVAVRPLDVRLGVSPPGAVGTHGEEEDIDFAPMYSASFITRAFAHTIARPAGVSIQSEQDMVLGAQGVPLIVSVRDVNFQPVQDASVDVFRSADADEAFGDDGACVTANVNRVGQVGQTACEVDLGDSTTDASGDLTDLSLQITDADATVWAWTGDRGDKFDSDDTTRAQLTVGFSKAATQTLVTDNLEEGQTRSKFGETVTVTIQIADPDDKAVADKGKRVTVAQSTTVGDNTTSSTNSMTTDADGKIVLEFTQTDPSTNTGDSATVTLTLTNPPAGLPFKNEDGSDFSSDTYSWSDEAPRPATLTVTSRNDFVLASDEGQGAGNTVTATLTDQFGDPVRGKRITFLSDTLCVKKQPTDAECVTHGVGANNYMRTTGRDGRANLGYNYDNTNSVIEAIRATYTYVGTEGVRGVVDTTDPLPMGDPKDEAVLTSEPVHHYWVEEPTGDPFTGRILVKDPDNDQVVVAAEEKLMLVKYDGNDQFNLESGTTIFSEFEKLLEENADPAGAHLKVTSYEDAAADVSVFTVQEEWPGLDHPAGANGRFNYPIVVADNGIIVVGHYLETVTSGGTQMPHAGAVYIYPNGMDTAANNIVKLTAPTPFACGYFGYDVDITDNTVVVGNAFVGIDSGRLRPVVGLGEGQTCAMSSSYEKKVYVYTRTDSGWPIDATFTSVDAQNNTGFGEGVAISSDGSTIAVVGPGSNNNGAVFVFEKPQTGGWADTTTAGKGRLRGGGGDGVGWIRTERSVAISGDGSVIAAGGCNNEGSTGTCGGWLYVYEKDPTASWNNVQKTDGDARFLAYEGTGDPNDATDYGQGRQSRHEFAKYVALSDDGTVLVASGHYRAEAEKPGEVYVWNKPETGGWRVHHIDRRLPGMTPNVGFKLKVSSPRNSDVFGQYIAVTGDGSEIAASRHYRQEGTFRGSVVTFKRPADGAWANDSTPDDEYLGPYVRAHLGWQTTYDKSNSDLYTAVSAANDMESPLSIFKITR